LREQSDTKQIRSKRCNFDTRQATA
jgi:hypothetical protein